MINLILSIVIMAIIFYLCIKENRNLKNANKALSEQLSKYSKYLVDKDLYISQLTDTIFKIQNNYSISKRDKIIIIQWLSTAFNDNVKFFQSLLESVNVRKTYTYKNACDIILKYCSTRVLTIETLNAAFYLLTK